MQTYVMFCLNTCFVDGLWMNDLACMLTTYLKNVSEYMQITYDNKIKYNYIYSY